jgi:fumarate reductase flavoprotein subunit
MMRKTLSILLAMMMTLGMVSFALAEGNSFTPGTYTGESKDYGGEITVEVTLSETRIEAVKVLEQSETPGIGSNAVEMLPEAIVAAQSLQVDSVGGATVSSAGILAAVTDALAKAGVNAAALVPTERAEPTEMKEEALETDVVVIGAGGAGMTAAIEAANAGRKVILLEKEALTGGNTTRATGGMNAADTPYQDKVSFEENAGVEKTLENARKLYGDALSDLIGVVEGQYEAYLKSPEGYFDTLDLYILDTLVGGKNMNDKELVQVLSSQSADGIEWLKSIGATLESVGSFGGASVKRIHRPVNAEGKTVSVGAYLVPILTQNVEELGIQILYNTPATELMLDNGAVTGVVAVSKDTTYQIKAKAVVIATGGFGANVELCASYRPDLTGFVTTNAPGATGDGIQLGISAGAATVDLDQIQIHPTVEQSTSALITEGLRGDGAILVNAEGKRFIDEVGTRDVVSAAEIAQPGSFAWLVIDQAMADASTVIAGYINRGLTVTGESYEALAAAMEVDPAALAATMEAWNKSVADKKDEAFGRTSFANPLDTAPFYAIKIAPGVHHTMGGLKINTQTRVLNEQGEAIPGLYAAGEVTGGVHGANRLGGNAVADIIVFGRIAGQQAAEYAK